MRGGESDSGGDSRGGGQASEGGNKEQIVIPLKGDNQGSIAMAHNPVFHFRTKHTGIQHHYIQDEVATQRTQLPYILMDEMIADGRTKPLTHIQFYRLLEQMNMQ